MSFDFSAFCNFQNKRIVFRIHTNVLQKISSHIVQVKLEMKIIITLDLNILSLQMFNVCHELHQKYKNWHELLLDKDRLLLLIYETVSKSKQLDNPQKRHIHQKWSNFYPVFPRKIVVSKLFMFLSWILMIHNFYLISYPSDDPSIPKRYNFSRNKYASPIMLHFCKDHTRLQTFQRQCTRVCFIFSRLAKNS